MSRDHTASVSAGFRRASVLAYSALGRLGLVAPFVAALWVAVFWAWGGNR